jgi:hypothetical protein
MSENKTSWLFSNRRVSRCGVPDLVELDKNGPQLEDIESVVQPDAYVKIKRCCRLGYNEVFACNHPLCLNCIKRTRCKLIWDGSLHSRAQRHRASLITSVKMEWELPVGGLADSEPGEIVNEVIQAMENVDHLSKGEVFLIGGLDISLNESSTDAAMTAAERKLNHVWSPHSHMALIARDPDRISAALEEELKGIQSPGTKHFRGDKSYCVGRTIAYATALKPVRRELTFDIRGNRQRKIRPLASERMKEALQWLAKTKSDQRIFTYHKQE